MTDPLAELLREQERRDDLRTTFGSCLYCGGPRTTEMTHTDESTLSLVCMDCGKEAL
jgi:translation initiation factor 2 beta subunit (eIF-2beta)/eIF-5